MSKKWIRETWQEIKRQWNKPPKRSHTGQTVDDLWLPLLVMFAIVVYYFLPTERSKDDDDTL